MNYSVTNLGMGIDAGGTYTDAVLFDLNRREVLAKSKALTTYHDLIAGIRDGLSQLPPHLLSQVTVTALSTTLATNAVVEGRGFKVGLILLTPFDWFEEQIGHSPCIRVPGAVDILGEVTAPLDEAACRNAVIDLVSTQHCAALAIGGYGAVRNPEQVLRAREIARAITSIPIVCAHEISRRLNALQAARTAVENARLIPVIDDLLTGTKQALNEFGVGGRLMVVKGDGTPVSASVARTRPIETLLSGPASSVSGARVLTGLDDALVMDIGGTTTDCAMLENGVVGLSPNGARVGAWNVSVDVVDINTVGLGGDSRIGFSRNGGLSIGPERRIPLSYLASESPRVRHFLQTFDATGLRDFGMLDVLVRGASARVPLSPEEERLIAILDKGPVPAVEAARELGIRSHVCLPLSRLTACGIVKLGSLTPTDLMHVSGVFCRWDRDAARHGLELFATVARKEPDCLLREVEHLLTRRLFDEIVRRETCHEDPDFTQLPESWRTLLDRAFSCDPAALDIKMSLGHPIIAIGAPAEILTAKLPQHLDARIVVPEHADVANAIGAIGSEVVANDVATVVPNPRGGYYVYLGDERCAFQELPEACEHAQAIVRAKAASRVSEAGGEDVRLTFSEDDSVSVSADGAPIFLERRIRARGRGTLLPAASGD